MRETRLFGSERGARFNPLSLPLSSNLKTAVAPVQSSQDFGDKVFRITRQIHKGNASLFVNPLSSRLLQISTMFNLRFKVDLFAAHAFPK